MSEVWKAYKQDPGKGEGRECLSVGHVICHLYCFVLLCIQYYVSSTLTPGSLI